MIRFLFSLFLVFSLFSQNTKDAKTTPEPAKTPTEEGKPVKMETGTVTLDPATVSGDLQKINLKNLKKMKSSFLNNGQEEKFKALTKNYVDANIKFQERKFLVSRRLFEQNQKDINIEAENFSKKYFELYQKLYTEASSKLVDFKINSEAENSINPSLEKYLITANEFFTSAQTYASKKNHIDALGEYKSAIQNVVKVFQTITKFQNRKLTTTEKYQANLLLEEDFIPKDYLKDYDDANGQVSIEAEKEREKEREQVKKNIVNKLGQIKTAETKDSKQAKEEPKKEAKSAEPAKK
jgi:hypothetical protein